MAKTAAAAEPRDPTVLLPPCAECNGVECGSARIAICCENCTH